MKKLSALLAAAALVGAASAYAANPFSDVPTDSWAYQAVSQLAAEGVVVGYPDGTFGGEKNITRYEMAQIIARALAVEDRANAEQRAVINKLAQEFGSELNSLGVRVAGLENRIGNVKITGDARLKYSNTSKSAKYNVLEKSKNDLEKVLSDEAGAQAIPGFNKDEFQKTIVATENAMKEEKPSAWTYRVRLNANAKVSENTSAFARLVLSSEFGKEKSTDVKFDRLYVNHSFGNVDVTAGRQGLFIGNGLVYDGALDGVVASAPVGPVNLVAGYGYPFDINGYKSNETTLTFAQVSGDVVDGVNLAAYYGKVNTQKAHVYGVAANAMLGQVDLHGEYAKLNGKAFDGVKDTSAWTVGTSYKYGPAKLFVDYVKFGKNAELPATTFDVNQNVNWKGFVAGIEYDVAKNTTAKFVYTFKGKHIEPVAPEKDTMASSYYAQLVYKF